MSDNFAELLDNFALFEDWEGRYRYLIDLGAALEPLDAADYCSANRVEGCVSQVWLVSAFAGGRFMFKGDSDAHIVKGLIAVLCVLYADKTPCDILAIDGAAAFEGLGFGSHLTPQRSNGFYAMVQRIRNDAEAARIDCNP